MVHKNPNRRERAKAKAYQKKHGISYQAALQEIRKQKAERASQDRGDDDRRG